MYNNRRLLYFILVASMIFAGLGIYQAIFYNWSKQANNILLIAGSGFLLSSMVGLAIVLRKVFLRSNTQRQLYGSRLQKKILLIFSLLSGLPALILAVLAALFSHYMINSWFDNRIGSVLNESVYIAESYLKEYQESTKAKAKTIADKLDDNILQLDLTSNLQLFAKVLNSLAELNDMSEAVVFHGHVPLVKGRFGNTLSLENIPDEYYKKAMNGEVVVFKTLNKIRAMQKLHSIPNSVIVVGKYLDSKVETHIQQSSAVSNEYKAIENNLAKLQFKFYMAFLIASLILVSIAGITGVLFSANIVKPIIKLVEATKSIKDGKFVVKLAEGPEDDEIANLSRAFNLMTAKVSEHQNNLMATCKELDRKNKFVQMVLSGVSTGIIAVSPDYKIELINDAGCKLLGLNGTKSDLNLMQILPESIELINRISHSELKQINSEVKLRRSGQILTFLVKVASERNEKGQPYSYIIAFEDMTKIFQTQRNEAWSDIARRIAHEVKNPLTPICLGAERIKEKYSKYIKDQKNFNMYINTIIKHSQDIRSIIEEFSKFARMPLPVFKKVDLSTIIKDLLSSYKTGDPNITFKFKIEKNIIGLFDDMQIRQVLNNIIKNAEESIRASPKYGTDAMFINVHLYKKGNLAHIKLQDTGKGFDENTINKITEPYFTTKTKGTGLGLAIVKKIVDDHKGELIIKNNSNGNAVVEIILPLNLSI